MDVTKAWVRVCSLDTLSPHKASELMIAGQRLTIARCGDGAYVLQGFCSHMLFPLAGNKIEGCILTCELHGSRFNVQDGSVVEWSTYPPITGAMLEILLQQKSLRTYETKIEDDSVFILWPTDDPETVPVKVKMA